MQELITLAQAIVALGATGILALIFVLWVGDVLHTRKEIERLKALNDTERTEHAKQDADRNAEWKGALEYRERLRLEAIEERKQSDARISDLTKVIAEAAELTRRTVALNAALFEELQSTTRSSTSRTRRGDRGGR